MKQLNVLTTLLIFTLLLAACGGSPPVPDPTPEPEPTEEAMDEAMEEEAMEEEMEEEMLPSIAEIATEAGSFTTLLTALEAAGLAETFAGEGDFTVFAPTDDAFAALPEGTVESLLEDPEGTLTQVLTYHVVNGAVMAETVVSLDSATTLQGEEIAISVDDGNVLLNETVQVVTTDLQASNGVIHIIDAVLLPPSMMAEETLPTIAEIATEAGTFNTLLAALNAAGLAETFADEGSFTVFAPTDDAFAALPEGTVESLLEDPEGALTEILLYHVADGAVFAETVVGLEAAPTLQGEEIAITVTDDGVFLNETIQVVTTDIEASNGVIHIIDGVLLPPSMSAEEGPTQSIAEIVVGDENFSTLLAALDAAGLAETFAGEGAFTVFAPTNDAFAALPEGTVESLLADPEGALTQVLTYHVVDGIVPAEVVVGAFEATTLQGEEVRIALQEGSVVLNGSVLVTMTDIEATNGIVHIIDSVLIPSTLAADATAPTIAEIVAGDARFSTLVAALDAAGLVDTFAGEGAFTVFAPTNAAFEMLPEGTVESLLEDPEGALTQILTYHVVDGVVPAETVVTLESATTLQGSDVTISIVDGNVFLNDTIQVIATDIEASNGVIHVIDMVLVPAE